MNTTNTLNTTSALKFKLYRHQRNALLHQRIDIAGCIWNHCIALHRRYYRLVGKHLNQFDLMRHLTRLKKSFRFAFWNELGSQAIQDIAQRIDRAYKLFFRNLKQGIKTAPPKFRKVKKYRSFTLKQAGWKLLGGNRVRIQGHVYKFSQSRDIIGSVKTVTVKRDTLGALWLTFVVENQVKVPNRTGNIAVGFDFGLKMFLTAADGSTYASPEFLKRSLNDLRQASRNLSRKQRYSKNWHKAKKQVARIHQRVVNQRHDWFFKLAHDLSDRYDLLFFEDLSMKGMQSLWGRKIGDLARSEFMRILEWVAQQKGKLVGTVDRFFPSSKTCSGCGYVQATLSLSERHWTCCECGIHLDRDYNASVNICTEGIRRCGVGDVTRAVLPAVPA